MAMGKRKRQSQPPLFVSHDDLPRSAGHPFYTALNQLLDHCGFEPWIQEGCRPMV
jgi:transposase